MGGSWMAGGNITPVAEANIYNDPEPEGDGFFDFIPGITVDQKYGRIIFPTIEPFGETIFNLLSADKHTSED